MRILRLASIVVTLLAVPAYEADAQVVVNEQRISGDSLQFPGMGREFKTGTGRIRGRVVAGDTGAPVRRAQVRLSGPEIGGKIAVTDANGVFEFRDLPAGRFTMNATKSGFMTVAYGQTRPFESGKSIDLTEGQALEKTEIAMPRGSVISGRILDEFGDPVPDASVSAMRSTWSNGRRRLRPAGRAATTNDLGQYRLFGLPPGEYYVSASIGGPQAMQMESMAVTMVASASGASQGSTPASGYAPTYFPGTTAGAEAQRLAVAVGQDTANTDFALVPVRLAKISGTVLSSAGRPAEGTMVSLVPRSPDATGPVFGPSSSGRSDKNGNFTLNGVAPGEYFLQTSGMQVISAGEGRTMVFTMRSDGPAGPSEPEVASVPVNVAGEDVPNVIVITAKGGIATGSVIFEGGSKPEGGVMMRVVAQAYDSDGPALLTGGSTTVKPDGTFELRGLSGGRIIRLGNPPQGWTLKAVRLNGQDITDAGADFKAGETVSGLEIVMTNKQTSITGGVTNAKGTPVKDFTVVLFSDDDAHWTVPQTRWVVGVRPDQEGRFQARNLPAGRYYAVAVDYIEQGTWGDPDLLQRLKASASTFSLDDGETKTLDLKISQ